jgi:hypothetical protein
MCRNRKSTSTFISLLVAVAMSAATVSYAGDITADSPLVIDKPGSYRLKGNIIVQHPGPAVEIIAENVTFDLNGYAVLGPGSGSAVGILAQAVNTTIINGSIVDMDGPGIDCGTEHCRIEKMRITRCGIGIIVGTNSLINDNIIVFNSGPGLVFPSFPFDPSGGPGLSGFSNNLINDNNGGNAAPQIEGSAIELGTNICGNTTNCSAGTAGIISPAFRATLKGSGE